MSAEIIVLRLVHILGGVFWAGAVSYMTFYVMPAIGEAGPAGGAVMAGLMRRRMLTVLPVAGLITILAGLRMLQVTSHGFSAEYFDAPMGQAILVGAVLATVGFLIGVLVGRPAMLRVVALMARREAATPDARVAIDTEVAVLRARGRMATTTVTFLLILTTALMAVARYL